MSVRSLVASSCLCLIGCITGRSSPDGPEASLDQEVTSDRGVGRDARGESGLQCPAGVSAPAIQSFSIVDAIAAVPVNTAISLLVRATGASGLALSYSFTVDPQPADPVTSNGDGTALWRLSGAPRTVFFTTPYTISVKVGYGCKNGPSSAVRSVRIKVWGNVVVANGRHHSIEALSSDGRPVGQVAGPAVLTNPGDMLLLNATELAVGDIAAKKVKVIDLQTGTILRLFDEVPGLTPYWLDLTPAGEVLVAAAANKLFRFSKQGALLQTITSPGPGSVAAVTHQSDGTIIVGTSGAGDLHAFNGGGTYRGLFAHPPDIYDTLSLLAIAGDEILFGCVVFLPRGPYATEGRLIRLSQTGVVLGTVVPPQHISFRSLRKFGNGYLFVNGNEVRQLDAGLQLDSKPLATLAEEAELESIVWLDEPPS